MEPQLGKILIKKRNLHEWGIYHPYNRLWDMVALSFDEACRQAEEMLQACRSIKTVPAAVIK